MSTFRIGEYVSLIDSCYAIQKKKWWGWSNWCLYDYKETAIEDAKRLEKNGHTVQWHL